MNPFKYASYFYASPRKRAAMLASDRAIQSKEEATANLEAAKLRRIVKAEKRLANAKKQGLI